jgi:hypothetical protein
VGINDLLTFEGSSVEELKDAFHYMIGEYIADCAKENIPAEKSYVKLHGNTNWKSVEWCTAICHCLNCDSCDLRDWPGRRVCDLHGGD